tara:strand:- start:22 stop:279 length:258 start_codon:yes stop_codon:yes gene_type:complete
MANCGLTEKHTLEDGTIYILDNRFKTGEEYFTKDGRPVIDCLGRFKGGKNVEKFLRAKVEIINQDLKDNKDYDNSNIRFVTGIEG